MVQPRRSPQPHPHAAGYRCNCTEAVALEILDWFTDGALQGDPHSLACLVGAIEHYLAKVARP